jgi:hypothetical protein
MPSSSYELDMRWICVFCNKIMDSTNFRDFIMESDDDKNSNQGAVVEYHGWRLLPEDWSTSQIHSTQIPGTATFLNR